MIIRILQIIAAVGTIVTGFISLIWPRSVRGFTGLNAEGGRGITEIRAVLAYQMLGIAYLVVAVTRAVSMFVDQSVVQSNIISLAVEIVFGVILIL